MLTFLLCSLAGNCLLYSCMVVWEMVWRKLLCTLCAGVLFYGDSAANGVKASSFVEVTGPRESSSHHAACRLCMCFGLPHA